MKILLTGGDGFLGRHIKTPIMEMGCLRYNHNTTMDMVERYNPDIIIHLAWEGVKDGRNDKCIQQRNIDLVKELVSHTNAKWIVAGSQAEVNTPNIAYARAKQEVREYLEDKVPLTWARIYSLYGPGDSPTNYIPLVIGACIRDKDIKLTDQNTPWDYLYVQDAADAFIKLLNAPKGIYELGSGTIVLTQDVAHLIKKKTNSKSQLLFGARPKRDIEIPYLCMGIGKIVPDWQPITSLSDGLDQTIEYFNNNL